MSESRDSSVQTLADAQGLSFYEKFINGEFGLAKTYWLFGVVPGFIAGIAVRTVSSDTLAYWIGAAFVIYQCVLLVALWNAGRKYQGSKVWPVLAFLVVMSAVLRNIGPVLAMGQH
jgi:hypothetical protein